MSSHSLVFKVALASSLALYGNLAISAVRPRPVANPPVVVKPVDVRPINSSTPPVIIPGGGGTVSPFPVITTCASGQASRC